MNKRKLTSLFLSLSLVVAPASALATSDEPAEPDTPEVPNNGGAPDIPEAPEIPEIPKAPEIPTVPEIPSGAPEIPEMPDEVPEDDTTPVQTPVYNNNDDDDDDNDNRSNSSESTSDETEEVEEIEVPASHVKIKKEKTKDGKTKVKAVLDRVKAEEMIASNSSKLSFTVPRENASEVIEAVVPSDIFDMMKEKNAAAVVEVKTDVGAYKLPVEEIDTEKLAKQLGTTDEVEISIQVNEAKDEAGSLVKNQLKSVSKIVDYKVEAVAGNKRIELDQFNNYVEREIENSQPFNSKTSTAVRLNDDGSVTALPTRFNGNTAIFKSLTNSKYTIIENEKTFADVKGHWAQENIELLASKLIVQGKAENSFEPNATLTRAEFTALAVRALGLEVPEDPNSSFKDIPSTKWYAGPIQAAVEAGLIQGYPEDGTFRANAPISRQELAVLMQRAIKAADNDGAVTNISKNLDKFVDQQQIAPWAEEAVALMVQTEITTGKTAQTFAPLEQTTRAEATTMLKRFLEHVEFINE